MCCEMFCQSLENEQREQHIREPDIILYSRTRLSPGEQWVKGHLQAHHSDEPRANERQECLLSISLPHPRLTPARACSCSHIRTLQVAHLRQADTKKVGLLACNSEAKWRNTHLSLATQTPPHRPQC